jgi:hypothetical protein
MLIGKGQWAPSSAEKQPQITCSEFGKFFGDLYDRGVVIG